MSDNLDKYLADFDEESARAQLTGYTLEELIEEVIRERKFKRVVAKMADESSRRLARVREATELDEIYRIVDEPSELAKTPGIPTADDLRRMMKDEDAEGR